LATGSLPVIYPFIVDDPGEAAPAKRRIGAVTIGHLPPPVEEAGLSGEAAVLRELVEEFSGAQVLDPRRADMIAREIFERADACGLAAECGVLQDTPIEDALTALDAHLCDLAEVAIRDGLHVFGSGPPGFDASSHSERDNLIRALDGRFVRRARLARPGAGGATCCRPGATSPRSIRGPFPRAPPRRWAEKAAREVIRRHLQDHGDYPRNIVMDLWASPTLRTGGEDIAHAAFPDGRPPGLGPRLDPGHRLRDHPAAAARPSRLDVDGAHLRRLSRHVCDPDRAYRPGGPRHRPPGRG
jgi:cobaltochelatase CobN